MVRSSFRGALDKACAHGSGVGSRKELLTMLRIYPIILSFVEDVAPFIGRIARCDPDLARQLRRASTSVALNTAEGMYARGRSRQACYNIALREMRESYAALEVSVLLHYLPPLEAKLGDRIQRILGTLYRLSFRARRRASATRACAGRRDLPRRPRCGDQRTSFESTL